MSGCDGCGAAAWTAGTCDYCGRERRPARGSLEVTTGQVNPFDLLNHRQGSVVRLAAQAQWQPTEQQLLDRQRQMQNAAGYSGLLGLGGAPLMGLFSGASKIL